MITNQKHQIPFIFPCHPNLAEGLQYFLFAGNVFAMPVQQQLNTSLQVKIEMDPPTVKFEEEIEERKEKYTNTLEEKPKQESKSASSYHPGETKNYYKNIGQKLANYINEEFKDVRIVQEDTHIRSFLKIESQKFNRLSISKLQKSKVGRRIARQFFANYRWAYKFLAQHKTELDLYFRHNCQLYAKKKNLPTQKNNVQVKEEQE